MKLETPPQKAACIYLFESVSPSVTEQEEDHPKTPAGLSSIG